MEQKKRLWLAAVLVLFIAVFSSLGWGAGEGWGCKYLSDKLDVDLFFGCKREIQLTCDAFLAGCEDQYDTGVKRAIAENKCSSKGCGMLFVDEDDRIDDCGIGLLPVGTVVDNVPKLYTNTFTCKVSWSDEGSFDDWPWEGDISCFYEKNTRISDYSSYICAADNKWYLCDEAHKGKVFWGEGEFDYLFNCTKTDSYPEYQWVKVDSDWDHDGYMGLKGDCQDNPAADSVEGCPKLDEKEVIGMTLDEIKGEVRKLCKDPKYSKCAVCINSGAPEVCGDNIDNDCNSETSDNCHKNQYACEQEAPTVGEEERAGPRFNNIYDERFSWKEINGQGYCCGYKGMEDLGKISGSDEGNFICLNKNKEVAGYEGEEPAGWRDDCGENWCWVSATGEAAFKIFTIKKPGWEAYDAVSNNEDWFSCQEGKEERLPEPFISSSSGEEESESLEELYKKRNRFYCYKEGDRWSWAECVGEFSDRKNQNIKGRFAGEGLFSLPLKKGKEGAVQEERTGSLIDLHSYFYEDFYGQETSLDFSGYNYLNLMLKFVDKEGKDIEPKKLSLPAGVFLIIKGPDGLQYFNKSILGYTTNMPFAEKSWMHLQVPIEGFKGIKSILIKSEPIKNNIKVKNVYLSKEGETALCSGEAAVEENSWLADLDQGEADGEITGEKICNALYDPEGKKAWLGNDDQVDSDSANCCGNNPGEYYSGSSENNRGCWNSQIVAPNATIMNVEFLLSYQENKVVPYYPAENLNFAVKQICYNISNEAETVSKDITFTSGQITLENSPQKIKLTSLVFECKANFSFKSAELINHNNKLKLYFLNKFSGENLGNKFNQQKLKYLPYIDNYVVIAKTEAVELSQSSDSYTLIPFTYACAKEECLLPLTGFPPYEIINPYPDLYELYFVSGSSLQDEVLIDELKEFNQAGNLKAKKVSQQVILINQEEDKGFYGCQAASFLEEAGVLKENLAHCSVKGDKFCSPQDSYQKEKVLINSWSKEPLTQWGYEEVSSQEYTEEMEFQLKEGKKLGEERKGYSEAVPGRNFLTNPGFIKFENKDLVGWELTKEGLFLGDEKTYVSSNKEENSLSLLPDHKLKSEKIAVGKNLRLYFSQNESCPFKIYLVDKDGNKEEVETNEFNTGEATYLVLEFSGPGKIEKPMIQIISHLGIISDTEQKEFFKRSGAACCPENWCWNGYACVEEMSNSTYLREKVGDSLFYRCIGGEWKHLPIKWDWNFEKFGFCQKEEQCFVLSNLLGGKSGNKAGDFYQGKFPICVESGEYIFDHYCNNGLWTSRTKLLASKLLEATKGKEYVIYCTDYQQALLDYENKKTYLEGEQGPVEISATGAGALVGASSEVINICFENSQLVGETGERLVPPKKNSCINNVCILQLKEGSKFKTAFATSLNDNSFLAALNLPPDKLNQSCLGAGDFIKCNLGGLEIEGELWYSPDLQAIVYGKEGISLNPPILQKVIDWFYRIFLFERELPKEKLFINKTANAGDFYLLSKDSKKIRASKELLLKKELLTAEYENFQTSVCDYVQNQAKTKTSLFGEQTLNCSKENSQQKVVVWENAGFWWPQLTGKLRIGK